MPMTPHEIHATIRNKAGSKYVSCPGDDRGIKPLMQRKQPDTWFLSENDRAAWLPPDPGTFLKIDFRNHIYYFIKNFLIIKHLGSNMERCANHPDRQALSVCHCCGKHFCESCLAEGSEFYYCKDKACQEFMENKEKQRKLPETIFCPGCNNELELSDEERVSGQIYCPECDALIDMDIEKYNGKKSSNFVELLSSLNQGDIGLIKSVLDDSGIEYYILGENFLISNPLIEPARFFIAESQMEDAKEALKEFDLHIFGVSAAGHKK
jgi:hypothetical protein